MASPKVTQGYIVDFMPTAKPSVTVKATPSRVDSAISLVGLYE